MGPSKAQAGVSEVLKLLYFAWFPAHRPFFSSKRLNLGQDASRWPKMRPLEAHLGPQRAPPGTPKMLLGVRQVGTMVTFVLYFTIQTAL